MEKELRVEILRKLECPICLNHMKPPINICNNGHSFCGACKQRINCCAICRCTIPNVRNQLLEKFVGFVEYPCPHVITGCTKFLLLKDLGVHENVCDYKFYDCPITSKCTWHGKLINIFTHVVTYHENDIICNNYNSLKFFFNKATANRYILIGENILFIMIIKLDAVNKQFKVLVQRIGPRSESKNYKYVLTFKGTDNVENISFTKRCTPYLSDEYFQIPYSILEFAKSGVYSYKLLCNITKIYNNK